MNETATLDEQQIRELITARAKHYHLEPTEWAMDEEHHRITAKFGRWYVVAEDEDRGLFDDEEGELSATVVGAPEHNNVAVAFYLTLDGSDCGVRVEPFEDVEAV